jgi:tRNA(His) 5'-end guanylyltransferase
MTDKQPKDTLGDKMKALEGVEGSRKAVIGMPLIVRLDGRAFHTFTKGLKRPFDENLTKLMQDTTKYLIEQTSAMLGYTQSDEITLVWFFPADAVQEYMFDGRYQKICSILSATATAYFNKHLAAALPEKADALPLFDARAWQVPTLHEAYQCLLWREKDAIKNSITMVSLAHFSDKEIHGVNGDVKKQMLREAGDPWEDYASCYRKGSYFKRVTEVRPLTGEELEKIPEKHRTTELVTRRPVKQVELPDLNTISEVELFK